MKADETEKASDVEWDSLYDDPREEILLDSNDGMSSRVHSWSLAKMRSVTLGLGQESLSGNADLTPMNSFLDYSTFLHAARSTSHSRTLPNRTPAVISAIPVSVPTHLPPYYAPSSTWSTQAILSILNKLGIDERMDFVKLAELMQSTEFAVSQYNYLFKCAPREIWVVFVHAITNERSKPWTTVFSFYDNQGKEDDCPDVAIPPLTVTWQE